MVIHRIRLELKMLSKRKQFQELRVEVNVTIGVDRIAGSRKRFKCWNCLIHNIGNCDES